MNFGLNFGLLHGTGGNVDACILESTDGTWYGYENSSFGSITNYRPLVMFSTKWKADGEVEASFGPTGDDMASGLDPILFVYEGQGVVMYWDITTSRYITNDINLTNWLIGDFAEGKRRCFSIEKSAQEVVTHPLPGLENVTHIAIDVTHPASITIKI